MRVRNDTKARWDEHRADALVDVHRALKTKGRATIAELAAATDYGRKSVQRAVATLVENGDARRVLEGIEAIRRG